MRPSGDKGLSTARAPRAHDSIVGFWLRGSSSLFRWESWYFDCQQRTHLAISSSFRQTSAKIRWKMIENYVILLVFWQRTKIWERKTFGRNRRCGVDWRHQVHLPQPPAPSVLELLVDSEWRRSQKKRLHCAEGKQNPLKLAATNFHCQM